jgi:hypothetical protein
VSSYFKFLRRVRIHGRECGAVARALPHKIEANPLSAVDRKVLSTTTERKVMSKTTFFKRIALTAIAALGFGMLSVAPSQATVSGESLTIGALSTDTTTTYASTIAVNETATAVLKHSWVTTNRALESVVVSATRLTSGTGTLRMTLTDSSSSVAQYEQPEYMASGAPGAVNLIGTAASQLNSGAASAVTTFTVSDTAGTSGSTAVNSTISLRFIAPSVAGTYNFVVSTGIYQNGGAASDTAREGKTVTWAVTVTAADVIATSASTSTLRTGTAMRDGEFGGTKEGSDSSVVASRATTVTTAAATIWVQQKNAASTANESMTVTVSGPAWVNTDSATRPTSGTAITIRNLGPIAGTNISSTTQTPIFVWSNGTAGTATITVSTISGTVLGTETVKFYGSVTTIVVDTTYRKILRSGGYASQPTIDVYATDAAGMPVPGRSWSLVSSNTTAVNSVTSGACTDLASDGYPGYYSCYAETPATSVSGGAATLTYRTVNPLITTSTAYLTLDHAVTLGSSASTVTLTSDKETYDPGEKMIVTATAVDSSGNPVFDGATGPSGIVANKSLGGTLTMNLYYDGKSTSQVRSSLDPRSFTGGNEIYAPNASGKFTLTYTYGTYSEKVATLTKTVGDDATTAAANAASDAAAEAIDAANAATDAANLAAEAADAATVAAEEARDAADAATAAVEALATEVATLMAALKAQITTLANTVAKIAKKVKA